MPRPRSGATPRHVSSAAAPLLVRALNEGTADFSTLVRCTDRILTEVRASGSRVRIGAGGHDGGRILASRDLAFLHPAARTVGGPAVRAQGDGRRQPVRAFALRGLHRCAARTRRQSLGAERIQARATCRWTSSCVPATPWGRSNRLRDRSRTATRRTFVPLPQGIEGAAEGSVAAHRRGQAGGLGRAALRGEGRVREHGAGPDACRGGRGARWKAGGWSARGGRGPPSTVAVDGCSPPHRRHRVGVVSARGPARAPLAAAPRRSA